MPLEGEGERDKKREKEMRLNFLGIVMKSDKEKCIYVLMHIVDILVIVLNTISLW